MSPVRPDAETVLPAAEGRRSRRWIVAGASLAGLAILLWARSALGGSRKAPGPRPVPVAVTPARAGEMTLNLGALGTVTPLNTVTVRSRVDGHLQRVAFSEGQMVQEGDLLAEIDPRPFQVQLMQAEGQLAKDQAAHGNALADQRRLQALVQQGIISRQQLDTQTAVVDQFAAALKADQAAVESAKLNLTYSRVTAPLSGKVGLRLVDPGNMVRASDATGLAVITPMQPINVTFTVAADELPRVLAKSRAGQRLAAEAWDRDQRRLLAAGQLVAVDNQVDPATGTVRMKARFANDDLALFPNQFVNVKLKVDSLQGAVLVPAAALQRSPQGAFVYVLAKDGTAELRNVEVQATEGETAAIGRGLRPGDPVVTEGMEKLRPGAAVALPGLEAPKGAKSK